MSLLSNTFALLGRSAFLTAGPALHQTLRYRLLSTLNQEQNRLVRYIFDKIRDVREAHVKESIRQAIILRNNSEDYKKIFNFNRL